MTTRAARAATLAVVAATGLVSVTERPAQAHAVGVSSGEYRLDGQTVYGDIGMADRELARWLPALDTNRDGSIAADELTAGRDLLAHALMAGFVVTADDQVCPGSVDRAWVLEGDGGAIFQLRFVCPTPPRRLTLALPMLQGLAPGHRHMARLFRGGQAQVSVLDRGHATWTLGAPPAARRAWRGRW